MLLIPFMLKVLVLILSIILFIYAYFKYSFSYWKRKCVPFLKPKFPFGNVESYAMEKKSFGEMLSDVHKEFKKQNVNFGGMFALSKPVLVPIDLNLIKTVLTTDFNFFHDRGAFVNEAIDPLSGMLVNLCGAKWKHIRAKITPNFTSSKMKMMFETMIACSEKLDNLMQKCIKSEEIFDIGDIIARFTTDNISSCAFGIDFNSLEEPNSKFRYYAQLFLDTTFSNANWRLFSNFFPSVMKFFKIPITNKDTSKFFLTLFKHSIDYREETKTERKDFLDFFIKLKNKVFIDKNGVLQKHEDALTFNEVAAQSFTIFMAGYETSATTLTFCLLELALNQEIQNELRKEIKNVLNKHDGHITYEAIMEMEYMNKVVYEALRKYPIIPSIVRECVQDYIIPGTDITINKGTRCWISILGIHMDPEYYTDPENFDPERFSEKEKAKRLPFSYLPFGDGPRICIGVRFAMLQMKICLTTLLKNNHFYLDSKTTMPIGFKGRGLLLTPNKKIWLRAKNISDN